MFTQNSGWTVKFISYVFDMLIPEDIIVAACLNLTYIASVVFEVQ